MREPLVVRQLRDKYARLRGQWETAEQSIEDVEGLQAIISASDRIDAQKAALQESMDHIVHVVRLWAPSFDPKRVAPIYPLPRFAPHGEISGAAYTILGEALVPLRTREIARLVAAKLGRDTDARSLARLDSAIHNALAQYVERGLIYVSGSPKRWSVEPPPDAEDVAEADVDPDAASSPSSAQKRAAWPPAGRPRRTGRRY